MQSRLDGYLAMSVRSAGAQWNAGSERGVVVGLQNLRLGAGTAAPKTGTEPAQKRSREKHGGIRSDSGRDTVAVILLSRVLSSSDGSAVEKVARSPYGEAVLQQVRRIMLRIARTAAPGLQETQVSTMLRTSGSTPEPMD